MVQRSGDIGSPRSSGSINANSAGRRPTSTSVSRLRPPPATRNPTQRIDTSAQLATPSETGPLPHPGRPGHRPDTAMPQRPSFCPSQPPPLPLIQVRQYRSELRGQPRINIHTRLTTTSTSPDQQNYALISGEPYREFDQVLRIKVPVQQSPAAAATYPARHIGLTWPRLVAPFRFQAGQADRRLIRSKST